MPTMTLPSIVQNILSDMDSDNVNSINDSVEAQQVALIVETTYREIIGSRDWSHLHELTQLTASGDSAKPVWMRVDDDIARVMWIKYNKIKSGDTADIFTDVTYLTPKEFLDIAMLRNEDSSNVTQYTDYNGTPILVVTDAAPTYWTSFDDEYVVFDSYNSAVDTTLQQSKTQLEVIKDAAWSSADTFVPDLPVKAFSYLLAEAKSTAFTSLKQMPNAKEEQKSRRQRSWLAREKWRTKGGITRPNYGRNV